jgi:hypothetical protein
MRFAVAVTIALLPGHLTAAELNVRPGVEYCDEALYVSAARVDIEESSCTSLAPQTKRGGVALLCEPTEAEAEPTIIAATIIEHPATDTLTYIDEDGPVTLERCE